MKRQNTTGQLTENEVQEKLMAIGLVAEKPIPDRGIDLSVYNPENPNKKIQLQVKGRGKNQTNKRYRWFQLRTTKKQRESVFQDGLDVSESWKKKIALCDFFIFVSLRFNEHWVLPRQIVSEIIAINKIKYGNRADNINGHQVEMDLDINFEGEPLTKKYRRYLNNYSLIKEKLESA